MNTGTQVLETEPDAPMTAAMVMLRAATIEGAATLLMYEAAAALTPGKTIRDQRTNLVVVRLVTRVLRLSDEWTETVLHTLRHLPP